MKKHKSVVAILLAVMMIFTMMPMMAFATPETDAQHKVKWAEDYSSVSIDGTSYGTVREFQNTGEVKATADLSEYTGVYAPDAQYYYDISFAKYAYNNTALTANYASYSGWHMANGLLFSAPDYVTAATKSVTATTAVPLTTLNAGKWNGEFVVSKDGEEYTVEDKGTEDQTFDVSVKVTFPDSSKTANLVVGTIKPKTITIKGAAEGIVAAEFWMDEVTKVSGSDTPSAAYDGAEHTVVTKAVKGYTDPEWSVYDASTGKWNAVSAVTIKDAGSVSGKATFYKTSDTKKETPVEKTFTAKINALTNAVEYAFDRDPAPTKYHVGTFEVVEGNAYDPMDFVVVYPADKTNKAQVAAVAANKDELVSYFKDYASFTTETKKSAPGVDNVSFALNKDLKDADKAALDKKYATLIKNLGLKASGASIGTGTTTVYNAPASSDFEVEFTSAPSKKTYHIKKASKTKKNYTFKVKAEASNGVAVTYKLINANSKIKINKTTGKITIKKGLKKGTYNIKVKAYVPEVNKTGYAQETQAIKIVIKK